MANEHTDELTMTRLIQMAVRLAECTGTDHPLLEEAKNTLALAEASRMIRDLYAGNNRVMKHALECAELAKNALTAAAQTPYREQAEQAAAAAENAAEMTEQAVYRTAGDAAKAAKMERDLREAAGKLPNSMAENIASILETAVQIRDEVQKKGQLIQKTADLTREIARLARERAAEIGTETGTETETVTGGKRA